MIIKSVRVETSQGIRRLVRHLYEGAENEVIRRIQGTPGDIADMHDDARNVGRMYAVRHWIIAPAEATTELQFRWVLDELAKEFGFTSERAVVIEHAKPRSVPEAFGRHWHVAVGEVDPVSGRVLSSSHDFARHEKIARESELKFRHELIPGAHTAAVVKELRASGREREAIVISEMIPGGSERPREAFTHGQHQRAKRKGVDLPMLQAIIKEAWKSARNASEFYGLLAEAGLSVRPGEEPDKWIVVDRDGQYLGALARLARVRKAEILERIGKPSAAACRSAAKPEDPTLSIRRAVAEAESILRNMENEARRRTRPIPPVPSDPPILIDARRTCKVAEFELDKANSEQDFRAKALAETERNPPRWWWLPSWRRTWCLRRDQALAACEAAEAEVSSARLRALNANLSLQRKENAVRDEHKRAIARIVQQSCEAEKTLRLVGRARELLAANPTLAAKGINELLSTAQETGEQVDPETAFAF